MSFEFPKPTWVSHIHMTSDKSVSDSCSYKPRDFAVLVDGSHHSSCPVSLTDKIDWKANTGGSGSWGELYPTHQGTTTLPVPGPFVAGKGVKAGPAPGRALPALCTTLKIWIKSTGGNLKVQRVRLFGYAADVVAKASRSVGDDADDDDDDGGDSAFRYGERSFVLGVMMVQPLLYHRAAANFVV